MRAEFIDFPGFETKARRYHPRRTTGDRLHEAVLMLAEAQASLLSHTETPWASITFSGSRHEIMLIFEGPEAVAAGERFIAALPDHEFAIPGQLVADATVSHVDHQLMPGPRMMVTAVLLLLEEA
ncbi:MAG: hypothetical protein APF78_04785 [Sphingomonadales bacterium BRH_c3]|nr:MAG: hypothetical protein APF78_04785 [Sphingomonadales bacterium BRH_c3]